MITFKNVTKQYSNGKKALDNISLKLDNKGMFFLVGESGSGKTTFLNMVSLLDSPSKGTIHIDDQNINELSNQAKDIYRNKHIGIIFQDLNLIEELSIKENIEFPALLQNKTLTIDDIKSVLLSVNLAEEDINGYPKYLSGGERQRVAIIRTLLKESRLFVADEPTGSLDEKNALMVMSLLKEISKESLVLIVTHQKGLAECYGDRIIELEKGKIITDKTVNVYPIEKTKSNKSIDLKTYKLPLKMSFKFATKWFTYKTGRMIFSLISFTLMLTALILAVTVSQFNETTAMNNGLKQEGVESILLKKSFQSGFGLGYNWFKTDESKLIMDHFKTNEVIKVYYSPSIARAISENGGTGKVKNYTALDNEKIEQFGFKLTGSLPKESRQSGDLEVVITNVLALNLGWITKSEFNDTNKFNEIIQSKTLTVDLLERYDNYQYTFKISGVIDTGYEFPDPKVINSLYQEKYAFEYEQGFHQVIIFSEVVVDDILNLERTVSTQLKENQLFEALYVSTKDKGYYRALNIVDEFPNERLLLSTRLDETLLQVKETQEVVIQVALVLGGLFILTSLIGFIGFVHNMVVSKENSIRIMRSLGTRLKDMNQIFIMMDLFITVLTVVVSTVMAGIAGYYINLSIKTNYYISIPILNLSVITPIVIGVFVFGFAYLVTYLNLLKTYAKNKVI